MGNKTVDLTVSRPPRWLEGRRSRCPECGRLGLRAPTEPGRVLYEHVRVEWQDQAVGFYDLTDSCLANELPLPTVERRGA